MGCVFSQEPDPNDMHPNVFSVDSIDDAGVKQCGGKLRITDEEIELHVVGRDAIKWPFKAIRKYGEQDGVFSFESGRRCQTGSGFYAFR